MSGLTRLKNIVKGVVKAPEIAPTPCEVIYSENKLRLLRYLPRPAVTHKIPVLICNSLVNRYYILDLMRGKSFVEYLVAQGFDVYMIDWGVPDSTDRHDRLEDYIKGYLHNCMGAVLSSNGAKRVSLIGYCMGGTMSLIYTALFPGRVKNLVLLATPVDFHNGSLLSLWGQKDYFNVDKMIDTYGNAPVEVLQRAFMMLKPLKNFTKYFDLASNCESEEYVQTFMAFDKWVGDAVPVAGETFRKFVKDTYQENLLVQNRMLMGRKRVDLGKIECPVLNVVALNDEIVPAASSTVLMDLIGSRDQELLTVKGGHHGLSIGYSAINVVWPRTAAWLRARSKR